MADGGYIGFIQELSHWAGEPSFRTHSIFRPLSRLFELENLNVPKNIFLEHEND